MFVIFDFLLQNTTVGQELQRATTRGEPFFATARVFIGWARFLIDRRRRRLIRHRNLVATEALLEARLHHGLGRTMQSRHDILVVNDRPLDTQMTLVALEQVAPRARVLSLESGREALEYLFATGEFFARPPGQPDLVLLSLELKGVSGLCVLDLMRAHPSTREIPVVLLGLEGDVRKYRRHDGFDADAYLTQPCDFRRYCAVLRGCVRHWAGWALPSERRSSMTRDRWPRVPASSFLQAGG